MSTKSTPSTEEKDKERRRKKYKYALVRWVGWSTVELNRYEVTPKDTLHWKEQYVGVPEIICDDQPYKVLMGMLKLLKED